MSLNKEIKPELDLFIEYIYLCLPPDSIWQKVFFIARVLGKRDVGHESWLVPCWTI